MTIAGPSRIVTLFVIATMAGSGITAWAGSSFTGDLVMSVGGDTICGQISVKGEPYRIDMSGGRERFSVVVDRVAGTAMVLIPEKKQYIELASSDPISRMNDPFQGLAYAARTATEEVTASETVNDYECKQRAICSQDQDLMTYWQAIQLDFPIKTINHVSASHPGT